jgi:multidrug efflux pump subunit AcrB
MTNDEGQSAAAFNLSRWAIQHAAFTRFLLVLLLAAGAYALLNMGQKEDPEFTFRVMIVQVVWPGSSVDEMQEQVVDKIERKLQEVPGLDHLRSYTRAGVSIIQVNIKGSERGDAVTDAFYQVRKKVADIRSSLPEGVIGPTFNDEFGDTYIALYALTGDGYSIVELEDMAKTARDQLLKVPGVAKVDILGAQPQRIHVDVPSKVLAERGLTLLDLQAALTGQNTMDPSGTIDTGDRSVRIAVDGTMTTLDDIRELRVRAGAATIRLGDIATVSRETIDPFERKIRFGGKDAVAIGVVMTNGFNVTAVGKDLATALGRIEAELPVGLSLGQIADQPHVVSKYVGEFLKVLGEAILIVLAVSFLSLGWRSGLVVALTIPLVLAATFAVMWLMGIDLQRISLGALIIALGLLVDDAMIAVEMMQRKLEEGFDKLSAATFAYRSTAFPMLTGTLITVAGFIPVGFAKSTAGEYVQSMFWVVGISLIVSWFAAVYFTPWLGYVLLKKPKHAEAGHHEVYDTRFYRALRATINAAVRFRKTVLFTTLLIFLAGVGGFAFIPQQFFPTSNRPEVLVDLWLPEGVSVKETERQARQIEGELLGNADIASMTTFIGEGAPRFYMPLDQQLRNPNFAQLLIVAKDLDARDRVIEEVRTKLANGYPSIRSKVDTLFNGPPVGWAVQLRVSGPDETRIREIADKVATAMRANPLIGNVHDDWLEPVPSARLEIDQDRARALGITSQTIRRSLYAAVSGWTIGEFREGDETIPIVLREPMDTRTSPAKLDEIYLRTATGDAIPLSQVARIVPTLEPGIQWRRDRLPTITVRGTVPDGVQSPDVTNAVYAQLKPLIDGLPLGYTIEQQGAVEESAISQASINAMMPAMVLVILLLLMIQLQHVGKTALVFATGPLGIIGASAALLLTESAFGFVAILGVIALLGIIMRNSVILMDQIDQDIAAGHDPWTAVVESAVRRFRPIMLTAAAAVLALIPISESIFWGPMAYAMMGGLIVATVLTIIVLPAAYAFFFRVRKPDESKEIRPKLPSPSAEMPAVPLLQAAE